MLKKSKVGNGFFMFGAVLALGLAQGSAWAENSTTKTTTPLTPNPSKPIKKTAIKPSTQPSRPIQTPGEPSAYEKISKVVSLSYFNVLRGGPLSDMTNRYQPAPDGTLDTSSTQNLESTVTAGWKFEKDWMFGAYAHFFYTPLGNPTSEGNANMQWLDPALVLSKANMVSNGGLKIKGQLSATIPTSQYDTLKKNGLITGITPSANILYDVPKTKLTLGFYTYFTAYIPGSDAIENYRTMKLVMAPNANYQFTSNFAATLWIDAIQVRRLKHSGFFSGMNNPEMDIEPGVNWDITPYLSFNPFLNIYPATPTLNATSIQAVVAGKIF